MNEIVINNLMENDIYCLTKTIFIRGCFKYRMRIYTNIQKIGARVEFVMIQMSANVKYA